MHTAAPIGRLHLIAALERIGDDEAVPVLRHLAVFDITAEIREAAERLLSRWAASSDKKLAPRARAALGEIARKRAAGHRAAAVRRRRHPRRAVDGRRARADQATASGSAGVWSRTRPAARGNDVN